jgi:two-component system cell cycle sensor histidine kinase/response regulator CckA
MAQAGESRWANPFGPFMRARGRPVLGAWAWAIDVMLLTAVLLAATTDHVVFWFHIVFLVLTVSAMFLGVWALALRAAVWVSVATLIVAEAVSSGKTQPEELVEIPLLSAILVVVFVVSIWRARALHDLERAQALLVEKYRSELSELERELETSRKMDALGRLTGGIAHDFNNVLTAILGHCEDLIDRLKGRPAVRPAREIEASVHRASSLVEDLMSFSRQHVLQPTVVDINEVVVGVVSMLHPLLGEDVAHDVRLSPDSCPARLVRNRFEQVVVNLAVNAREAMPHGGRIEFATRVVGLESGDPVLGELPKGQYAAISVIDNGIGIEPNHVGRIFEPFFTTKDNGRGAGLGLSTVRDIVSESGGSVTVESEPGHGTRVTVYLPVTAGEVTIQSPSRPTETARGGTETILLIEDDAAVRARARKLLEGSGYTVLEAPDGEHALQLADRQRGPIDLLVTDVVMPGMDGPTVARRLTQTSPTTRVLFVSGYTLERIPLPGRFGTPADVLSKPFTREELLCRARAVLDHS